METERIGACPFFYKGGCLYTGVLFAETFEPFLNQVAISSEVEKGNDVLAFRNPDGETLVFCMNREATERDVRLACGDKMMILKLQPKTFNTIIY